MLDISDIEGTRHFHGHSCPGLAIGIRAAEVALQEIGKHAAGEEMVSIVETDMCGVDAIQYLSSCTFEKGNLIHRDYRYCERCENAVLLGYCRCLTVLTNQTTTKTAVVVKTMAAPEAIPK